jgi:transcription initiation factor IIE alpha subunit
MNVIKTTDTCWICKGEYKYIYDKECEDLGGYAFECQNCGEKVLSPKNNPSIIIEGDKE